MSHSYCHQNSKLPVVIEFVFKSGSPEMLEDEEELLKTLHEYCQIDRMIKVKVSETRDIFNKIKPLEEDYLNQISLDAISRFFPDSLEPPYDQIDRVLYLGYRSFALLVLNVQTILNHSSLDSFDATKYAYIYEALNNQTLGIESSLEPVSMPMSMPMVWLELFCVHYSARGQGYGHEFLESVLNQIKFHFPKVEKIIVGLDVPGTQNRYINARLKKFYEDGGFNLMQMYPGKGSLIGYRILENYN